MELVSVIVPVYNAEARLSRCVESILKQDWPALEVILVDDGSRDGSGALMDEFARRDSRVKVVHKPNGGVSSARNRGLEEARGAYIQVADADDWLPLEATKLLVREMESSGAQMVIGDFYRVVEENVARKGSIDRGGVLTRREYADEMMRSPADLYYGVLWNKLYRREIIQREHLRMDENVSFSEDMIFNLEYLLHAETIAVLKAPVYYYHLTRGSLVEQNMDLASAVKMKSNVIGYYCDFYKHTFEPAAYQERLPVIYGFLLAVSRDSLALPFAPGTKKLGTESGEPIWYSPALDGSPLQNARLRLGLLDRYLDTLGKKHGLDRGEVTVLYLLKKLDGPVSARELAGLAGLTRAAVLAALARLMASGLAKHAGASGQEGREGFVFAAGELAGELELMERDLDAVCCAGISPEDLEICRRCETRIAQNLRERLSPREPE